MNLRKDAKAMKFQYYPLIRANYICNHILLAQTRYHIHVVMHQLLDGLLLLMCSCINNVEGLEIVEDH